MQRELFYVHIAVLLFGLSGLFANWILLPAPAIVLGRVFFAAFFLFLVLLILKKKILLPSLKAYFPFLLLGAVLAVHWGSFFHAIQLSSVAVGLVTFATFPIFASFLEPIFFKEKFNGKSVIFAAVTFTGVLFIIPDFDLRNEYTQGAAWGLISAVTFAFLSILNRAFVRNHSSLVIGFYQNFFAFFCLVPFLPLLMQQISLYNLSMLLLLGILFTGIAHVVFIQGLTQLNVRTASIIASLEPVYGIAAAAVIFFEVPVLREWIGILLILSCAMFVSFRKVTSEHPE
ncbi:DMT family transporter [Evansella sp. LMS18]|uniref:DMT family transporter n=1 Tax=Evansella sp. LMS18 TaxID=2924033 RepID=UPI0020D06BCC|nr:DMT family transporter [Evansella sp. LMS18]UTR09118.1 DMT family transporter [Evansella sp. LMS18]